MMKKRLLILLAVVAVAVQGWAFGYSIYYEARVKLATSPSGKGYVYAATSEYSSALSATSDKYSEHQASNYTTSGDDGASQNVDFYFYARAIRGYKFCGWKSNLSDVSYASTENGWKQSYTTASKSDYTEYSGDGTADSPSTDSNNAYYYKDYPGKDAVSYYAIFEPRTDAFDVSFEQATNGSYRIEYKYDDETLENQPELGSPFTTYKEDVVTLSAPTANENYCFQGWYIKENDKERILSYKDTYATSFTKATTVGAKFGMAYTVNFASDANATALTVYQGDDTETNLVAAEGGVQNVTPATTFTVSTTPADGYECLGWYLLMADGSKLYLTQDASGTISVPSAGTVYADIVDKTSTTPVFVYNDKRYEQLTSACAAAAADGGIITLYRSGTINNASYEIPANVTLLIPFDAVGTCYTTTPKNYTSGTPSAKVYKTLTLQSAKITVNGSISVSAEMLGAQPYNGSVYGPYGLIKMDGNSNITLNDGANLYAWGYITGVSKTDKGSVVALNGSTIYENFQIADYRGGTNSSAMENNAYKVFPFNQYYIQNIEVPMTINYGANEFFYSSNNYLALGPGQLVGSGENGLFRLAEGASLTKEYDAVNDKQKYILEGTGSVDELYLMVSSRDYTMPLTNNMSFEIKPNAIFNVNCNVCMQAGCEVKIDKDASMNITKGNHLYVYDATEWNERQYVSGGNFKAVIYSPSWNGKPTKRTSVGDASIDIEGTLTVDGALYTTKSGANIYSTGSGSLVQNSEENDTVTYQVTQSGYDLTYYAIDCTPVKLQNADKTYASTSGLTAGTTVKYTGDDKTGYWYTWQGVWKNGETVMKPLTKYMYKPNSTDYSGALPTTSDDTKSFAGWTANSDVDNQIVTYTAHFAAITAEHDSTDATVADEVHNEVTFEAPEEVDDYVLTVTEVANKVEEAAETASGNEDNPASVESVDLSAASTIYKAETSTDPETSETTTTYSEATAKEIHDAIVEKTQNNNTLVILPASVKTTTYVPEGKTDTVETPNVIVKENDQNVCKNLVVTEGKSFNAPADFTATQASYTRTTSNAWGTICLPYEVKSDEDIQYYTLKYTKTENGTSQLVFQDVDHLDPNQPGLFKQASAGKSTISNTAASVEATPKEMNDANYGWTMVGTYKQIAVEATENAPIYYIAGGTFYNAYNHYDNNNHANDHKVNVAPFRAYFQGQKLSSNDAAPSRMVIAIENNVGTVTSIGELDAEGNIQETNKFLQDGRLYIRKNGHIFNAAGTLVK